jgi:hypothetical protein
LALIDAIIEGILPFKGEATAAVGKLIAPVIDANFSHIQTAYLGISKAALERDAWYAQNLVENAHYPPRQGFFGDSGQNVIPSAMQELIAYNAVYRPNNRRDEDAWTALCNNLKYQGITPNFHSTWAALIELSGAGVSIQDACRAYHRLDPAFQNLDWYWQRLGISRERDRDQILRPFLTWGVNDWRRIATSGLGDPGTTSRLQNAVGAARDEDVGIYDLLASAGTPDIVIWAYRRGIIDQDRAIALLRLGGVTNEVNARRILAQSWTSPDGNLAGLYVQKQAFDDGIAAMYGLDLGINDWFRARCRQSGMPSSVGGTEIENAVANGRDYPLAAWRASRPMPGFGECLEMQWRLRPLADGLADSIIPGVQAWTEGDTENILRMQGYTEPIINRLLGLAQQPLNIRIVLAVLHEIASHPEVAADAAAAFGAGQDWATGVFLSQGLPPPIAKLAGDAMHAKAYDQINAEQTELTKKIRAEAREVNLRRYEIGAVTREFAVVLLTGEQCNAASASALCDITDARLNTTIIEEQIESLERGFMAGKVGVQQVNISMTALGITPIRQAQYLVRWQWKRTEQRTMLSTGEVLQLMKDGLITPQAAQIRLVNLGWDNGDALLEIARVAHDIAHAQSVAAAHAASQAASAAAKAAAQARREAAAEAHAESTAAHAAAAAARSQRQQESVELVTEPELADAADKYTAAVAKHAVAIEKAKGDADKIAAADAVLDVAKENYQLAVDRVAAKEVSVGLPAEPASEAEQSS